MLEIGKPLSPELQEAIKEETNFTDWVIVCLQEGNKTSAYTVKGVVTRGENVTENSLSTIESLVRMSIVKLDNSITRKEKCKGVLKMYNRLSQIKA